jgi:NDP-sugar pyrophosphorylase family protein
MHAVVVAGEHSWGGGVFEELGCRPLMEVAGRPLIVHIVEWLARQGIRSAGICANSHAKEVRHCLGEGQSWGISLQYYTDVMPRGPAGCVRDAAIDSGASDVLVVTGMVFPRAGIVDAYARHRESEAAITVVSSPVGDHVLEPSGVYLFSRDALNYISPRGYQDIKEALLPQVCRAGQRVQLFRTRENDLLRITDLNSYVVVNRRVIEDSLESLCGPEYIRLGESWVHRACDMDPNVRIIGPAIIGPGCTIEGNAVIVGPTSIGMGCQIGAGAAVCRSTVCAFSRVGQGAVVDNCLLSQGSVVAGTARLSGSFWTQDSRPPAPLPPAATVASARRRLAS